jgi:hypothetical protein
MKDYFEHNQEKKKKALLFLSDAKTISKYLDAQVSNIEVSNDDQEEN